MGKTGCPSSDTRLDIGEGVESFEGHNILYELLRNPESYSRLRAEVDGYFPPDEHAHPFVDSTKLAEMSFLNAVMYAPSIQAFIGSTDAWP